MNALAWVLIGLMILEMLVLLGLLALAILPAIGHVLRAEATPCDEPAASLASRNSANRAHRLNSPPAALPVGAGSRREPRPQREPT